MDLLHQEDNKAVEKKTTLYFLDFSISGDNLRYT